MRKKNNIKCLRLSTHHINLNFQLMVSIFSWAERADIRFDSDTMYPEWIVSHESTVDSDYTYITLSRGLALKDDKKKWNAFIFSRQMYILYEFRN